MNKKPVIKAGTFIGLGMGGFIDGILFHQILQIHSMFSATVPTDTMANMQRNMVGDGLFHLITWIFTAVGIGLLWRAARQREVAWSGRVFFGSLLMGWGIFNLVEGIIDHHILGLHHVVERLGLSIYDYAFLASGVLLIAIGRAFTRTDVKDKMAGYRQAEGRKAA
jgi:uncharacterized membrane protein